jgi:hypothetical protein
VVAGTVALMLQANPALTPNLVKAILQYTAERRAGYDDLTQGAGFLNARGAVQLARSFAGDANAPAVAKDPTPWNSHINWGNHRIGGGVLNPNANAWRTDVIWGATATGDGEHITWGTICGSDCDNLVHGAVATEGVVWGTTCADQSCRSVVWSTSAAGDPAEIVSDRPAR